ncbi:MAG: hypothetical protein KGZ83_00855, partial [Sulfuricella sp.]|nr:hypothetical protein [Sulfuricella sp.]
MGNDKLMGRSTFGGMFRRFLVQVVCVASVVAAGTAFAGFSYVTRWTTYNGSTAFDYPSDVGFIKSNGNLLIVNSHNGIQGGGGVIIQKPDGTYVGTLAAPTNGGPAYVATDSAGNVYVTIFGDDGTGINFNSKVLKYTESGGTLTLANTWTGCSANAGFGPYTFKAPSGIIADSQDRIYVADAANKRIVKMNTSGQCTGLISGYGTNNATAFSSNGIRGIDVDSNDNLFATEMISGYLIKWNSNGVWQQSWRNYNKGSVTNFSTPVDITIDRVSRGGAPATNYMYITENGRGLVKLAPDGSFIAATNKYGPTNNYSYSGVWGATMAYDPVTQTNYLYIADFFANTVVKLKDPSVKVTVSVTGAGGTVAATAATGGNITACSNTKSGTGSCVDYFSNGDTVVLKATKTTATNLSWSNCDSVSTTTVANDTCVLNIANSVARTPSMTFSSGPTAAIGATTGTSTTGATLNGTVNANSATVSAISFEYGTTTSYGTTVDATPSTASGSSATAISASLTGLTCNTTYHARVKASYTSPTSGTATSGDTTFATSACPVSTVAASSIVTVGSPQASVANLSFTVTFSEAVSGVDASDFTLTATGTATGTIGTPTTTTGVPATDNIVWTVPITGVSGDGTLRLDLKSSSTSIAATAAGNAAITGGYTTGTTFNSDHSGPTTTDFPTTVQVSTSGIAFKVTISETGNGYWMIVPNGSAAPTAAQIFAGANYGAVTIKAAGNSALTGNTSTLLTATASLVRGSSYDLYFAAKDQWGNAQSDAAVKSVIGVTFPGLAYTTVKFPEAAGSNGTIPGTFSINLTGNSEQFLLALTNQDLVALGKVTVANLPQGLTASVKIQSIYLAYLTFSGTATNRTDVSNLTLTFGDGAFFNATASSVTGYNTNNLVIDFNPGITYSATTFSEASANDGSIGSTATVTLTSDTFNGVVGTDLAAGSSPGVTFSNVPAGLTGRLTITSATTATLSFAGNALSHAAANNVSNVGLTFNGAAFAGGNATNGTGLTTSTIAISFTNPPVSAVSDTPASLGGNATTVTFTVTFSQAVSGVDASDFTLTSSGTAAGTIGTPTTADGGLTWLVPISGVSGDGTLRLDLKNSGTNIVATVGNGVIVGGYTSGTAYTADNTAPATDSFPISITPSSSGLPFKVTVNEKGDGYWMIVPTNSAAPTAAQIIAGSNYGAVTVTATGNGALNGNTSTLMTAAGSLTAGSSYDVYFVAKDQWGNAQGDAAIKSVVGITFPTLTYSTLRFAEASTNDGAISGTATLTLSGAKNFKAASGSLVENTDFTVTNLPTGLTASVTLTSATTATLAFSGTATSRTTDVGNLTLTFLDAAFSGGGASSVVGYNTNTLAIDFNPSVGYNTTTFVEASANDGSITATATLTLTGDTFNGSVGTVLSSGTTPGVTFSNVPAGLTARLTIASATTATLSFTGNAIVHAAADSVANVGLAFNGAAFTGGSTANGSGITTSNIAINFSDPVTATADAPVGTPLASATTVTFTVTFSQAVSGVDASDFTLTRTGTANGTIGTPTTADGGLTWSVPVTSVSGDGTMRLDLNGNGTNIAATAAGNVVISGGYTVGSIFTADHTAPTTNSFPIALTPSSEGLPFKVTLNETGTGYWMIVPNGSAAPTAAQLLAGTNYGAVTVSAAGSGSLTGNTSTLMTAAGTLTPGNSYDLYFIAIDQWGNAQGDAAVKSVLGVTFPNLTYSTVGFSEATSSNGSIPGTATITLNGETFTGSNGNNLVALGKVVVTNLPAGLTASLTLTSATTATLAFSGSATNRAAVSNLTLTFQDSAFTGGHASNVVGYNTNTLTINFNPSITYSTTTFAEAPANDGSITATATLTLTGDTFNGSVGTDLSAGESPAVVFSNVPTGLTAQLLIASSTTATLRFTGNAGWHSAADSVSTMGVTFNSGAFSGAVSGSKGNSIVNSTAVIGTGLDVKTIAINFSDSAPVPTAPTVTTGSATTLTDSGATLGGTVNDNNADTTVTFDYGTTTGYGSNVAATTGGTVVGGSGSTAVSVTLAGLSCATTYHFRVKGQNSGGTSNGNDQTFATSTCTAVPTTPSGTTTLPTGGGSASPSGGQTLIVTENGKDGTTIVLPTAPGSSGTNIVQVNLPGTGTIATSSTSSGTTLGVTHVILPGTTTSVSAVTVDSGSASFTATKSGQAVAGLKNGIIVVSGSDSSKVTVDTTGGAPQIGMATSDTIIVPKGTQNVSGTVVNLPAPPSGGGSASSVTVKAGDQTITVQSSQSNTTMTFQVVDIGGVKTPVLAISGSAQVGATEDNQPLVSVGGSVIHSGNSGTGSQKCNTIIQASSELSKDVVHVKTCYIILPAGTFSALSGGMGNDFAAIKDGIVWAGETAEFDKNGMVIGAYLGTQAGTSEAVGDDTVP